jgi:hypothetical protein
MEKNTVALFNDLNQWDSKLQQRACTIFETAVAMKYNIKWVNLLESDLDIIIKQQIKNWKLSVTSWWKAIDWIKATIDYANKKYWKNIKYEIIPSINLKRINELLDLWYAISIMIKVNQKFIDDVKDWKMDESNYFKYTTWKTLWHDTTLIKWKWRFTPWYDWEDLNKLMIIDTYAFNKLWRQWIYSNLDISQLRIISQNNFYLIYE